MKTKRKTGKIDLVCISHPIKYNNQQADSSTKVKFVVGFSSSQLACLQSVGIDKQ